MNTQYPCVEIENEMIELLKCLTYEQLVSLREYGKQLLEKQRG